MMSLLQPQISGAALGGYVHSKWEQVADGYGIARAEPWGDGWWSPGKGNGLLPPSDGYYSGMAMSFWMRCWDTSYDVSGGVTELIGPTVQIGLNNSNPDAWFSLCFRHDDDASGIKGLIATYYCIAGERSSTIDHDQLVGGGGDPLPGWDSSDNLTGAWFWVSCSIWGRHSSPWPGLIRWHIGDEDGNLQVWVDPQSTTNGAVTQNSLIDSVGHGISLGHPNAYTADQIVDRRGPFDICQIRYHRYKNYPFRSTLVHPYSSDWWTEEHWRYPVDLDLEEDDLAVNPTYPSDEYWESVAGWTLDNVTDGLVEQNGIDGGGGEMTFQFPNESGYGNDGEWGDIDDGPALLTR
jgi:hypothetical protein